jgi:hypothetical protein
MATIQQVISATLLAAAAMVGEPTASAKGRSAELIEMLKASDRPLSTGAGDCASLAKYHPTLGALVTSFEKQANGRKSALCTQARRRAGVLSCWAEFANKVPSERSEEEFLLKIEFELKSQVVGSFTCYLAG